MSSSRQLYLSAAGQDWPSLCLASVFTRQAILKATGASLSTGVQPPPKQTQGDARTAYAPTDSAIEPEFSESKDRKA